MRRHQGVGWLGRPIVLISLAIIALSIFAGWRRLAKKSTTEQSRNDEDHAVNPVLSLPLSAGLFGLFAWAGLLLLALETILRTTWFRRIP